MVFSKDIIVTVDEVMDHDDISIHEILNAWETRADLGEDRVVMFLHGGEDVEDIMVLFRVRFVHGSLIP